jgi:hypothetical protein
MTIGFAVTYLENGEASFVVAADCRYSTGAQAMDVALKTFALGRQTGAVAAGNALSVVTAAEVTRAIAEDHDRHQPDAPINFYSTVRLFSFFLDRSDRENPWSRGSEVALVGFLENGSPALAKVRTRLGERTEVYIYAPKQQGSLVMMVGQKDAQKQVAAAITRTLAERRNDWASRAASTIWYLSKHEGEPTIGGGLTLAACERGRNIYWPFVTVDGRTYVRGFDITETVPNPQGTDVARLTYDESWHAETDHARPPGKVKVRVNSGCHTLVKAVDTWVKPTDLFRWNLTPAELSHGLDPEAPSSVLVVLHQADGLWAADESDPVT